ncbi:helix-turn-helix domain-containing protein [Solimonas flava]|uniref:helix-turn-helix domain-containing protein n=1 Tax=Solimonas flava TaxID=415849 RepID=UPI00048761B1|nr:helix-turn-helix transcriptional regulator [Solimonas flava]
MRNPIHFSLAMADITSALKSEITRLSKKVVRQHSANLRKASTAYRRDIAGLKQQVVELQREVTQLRRGLSKASTAVPAAAEPPKTRFVAKGLKSLRARLGISARELGLLVGVSEQAVYNWEGKTAVPRATALEAIAELRGIGKKETRSRLEQLEAQAD